MVMIESITSKKLTATEQNCTANDRELLALITALQRVRYSLEGATVDVLTDNQVIQNFLTKKSRNRREARWLDTWHRSTFVRYTLSVGGFTFLVILSLISLIDPRSSKCIAALLPCLAL